MAKKDTVLKGYIKTESMILWVALALAVGFVGGVTFSVYRSTHTGTSSGGTAPLPATDQQKEMLQNLIARTQKDPKDVDAWTRLGHLYFDMGEPSKAIPAYETSLRLAPDRPDVWTDLGVMYRRVGKPQKSVECFDRALQQNPDHQIALYNKGIVLMHDLKDPGAALKAWERLVQLNPQAKTPAGEPLRNIIEQLKKNLPSQ